VDVLRTFVGVMLVGAADPTDQRGLVRPGDGDAHQGVRPDVLAGLQLDPDDLKSRRALVRNDGPDGLSNVGHPAPPLFGPHH
jgi:hypothetical protein